MPPRELRGRISEKTFSCLFDKKISDAAGIYALSPQLSAHIVQILAKEPDNQNALDVGYSLLPNLRHASNNNWAQEDAIHTAMAAFGIWANEIQASISLKRGTTSGLSLIGSYLYEDNVIRADASKFPGFDAVSPDVTGRAVFQKRDERLVIYTANKLPLEEMLGVDLIYINDTRGNIVMIQYKMLEENDGQSDKKDWIYRPDKQLSEELARMHIPACQGKISDYRLNNNPFFFKFVKRKVVYDSHKSFLIALDHLKLLIESSEMKGPRGGVRLSYDALDGTYLRDADMIGLIRSGYVGTHQVETQSLARLISEVAKGNRAVVAAFQH